MTGPLSASSKRTGPRRPRTPYSKTGLLGEGNEAAVIVRELETGREHCFRVDLETGETKACG